MEHIRVRANEIEHHVARLGSGPPLLLMHGWPEFWAAWETVMPLLADRFTLIAPDFRGFGESEKPDGDRQSTGAGSGVLAADMLGLLDALGISRAGLVGHDISASVIQEMARAAPQRIAGIFCFDCPHPAIGRRWIEPGHVHEVWYQNFHQLPWAARMVGASRETCRIYFEHFLRHWSVRQDWVAGALDAWVENFMRPGNLQGGFNWYISRNASRLAAMRGEVSELPRITVPTRVRWGNSPVLPSSWGDTLGQTFADLDFAELRGVGHFPHREDPTLAAAEIRAFFETR
jgi:pimeloyl-ACP methyl ester carboxylesterase